MNPDYQYCGIPFKAGGLDRAGLDCRGLALLWLREQACVDIVPPPSTGDAAVDAETFLRGYEFDERELRRGDVVFFRQRKTGKVVHVGVWLGENKLLHILCGVASRIDNGFRLLERLGYEPAGIISPEEVDRLARALSDPKLGAGVSLVGLIVYILLAVAVSFLMPKPNQNRAGNRYGLYGFDGLVTRNSPEMPLPDLLGSVTVAGNSPYTSLIDKSQTVSTPSQQRANKIILLASAPSYAINTANNGLQINGLSYADSYFKAGTGTTGIAINPTQDHANACDGTIGADTYVPSITTYTGAYDITVPVDIRAQWDRNFPIYGLSGCSYLVMRLIDSTKFSNLNVTTQVQCRKCRTFDSSGWIRTTATGESLAGADGVKVRFKLAFEDIDSVTSITVNAVTYNPISASAQTGNVYRLNKLKGYVEFITAPAAAATILITYVYFPRAWSQNPAVQVVYLLTEAIRGKAYDESKINWGSFVSVRDYCDTSITWANSNGITTGPRYTSNYAIDFRKPIQEHIRAILDACYSYLFISNGQFYLKARKSDTSVFSFNEGNILEDSFSRELIERSARHNRIKVLYHSAVAFNTEVEVIRDDLTDQRVRAPRIGGDGVVESSLKFPAVDNQVQAEIIGSVILAEEVGIRWVVELKTNVRGLALQPGDVVDVTHSAAPNWAAKLFRVEQLAHDSEDRLTLKLSEYLDVYI